MVDAGGSEEKQFAVGPKDRLADCNAIHWVSRSEQLQVCVMLANGRAAGRSCCRWQEDERSLICEGALFVVLRVSAGGRDDEPGMDGGGRGGFQRGSTRCTTLSCLHVTPAAAPALSVSAGLRMNDGGEPS